MQIALIITLTLSSLLAVAFIVIRVLKGGYLGLIAKAVASSAFFLTGIILASLNTAGNPIVKLLFIIGLALGVMGDVQLDFRQAVPERKDVFLKRGICSFGVGHIFYLIGFVLYALQFIDVTISALAALIAIPVSALGILGVIKVLKMKMGGFIWHSFLYLLILTYVALFTFSVAITGGVPYMGVFAVGAFLFLASDFVLSFQYFGGQEKNRVLTVVNHVLYYAAQLIFAALLGIIV